MSRSALKHSIIQSVNKSGFTRLVALLLVLATCSCASSPSGSENAPAWAFTGESPRYPRSSYLTGVGSADYSGNATSDYLLAGNRARADILAQLVTQVTATFQRRAREASSRGETSFELESSEYIETKVAGSLIVEPEQERVYDADASRVYVLMAINRSLFASALKNRLKELHQEQVALDNAMESLIESGEALSAYRKLPSLKELVPPYDVLSVEYEALAGQRAREYPMVLTTERLLELEKRAKDALRFDVDSKGDARLLADTVSSTLSDLELTTTDAQPTHHIELGLAFTQKRGSVSGSVNTEVRAQWTLTLFASGSRSALFSASYSDFAQEPARGVVWGNDAEAARDKALFLAKQQIENSLRDYLLSSDS